MAQEERRRRTTRRPAATNQGSHTSGERHPAEGRRTQPRRRRGPNITGVTLYVLFIIGISALLAAVGWVAANDMFALNKAEHSYVITVEEGESFGDVVKDLEENGIIEHPLLFRLFAAITNGTEKVVAGTYELDTEMDYRAILTNMSARSGARQQITVTIPEGMTVAQTFALLEEKGVSTVEKLNEEAANHDYDFSFLQDIPLGEPNRLEGYLFPDTYDFYLGEDPVYVINKMLVNFDKRLTDDMRQEIWDSGMSIHDIIIIASMIEEETDGTDQTIISSVIYNRLNGTATNGLLNIDATIQYILPERKENLTSEDLAIDSPYNTYLYPGLPAGPITNPGMAAIRSAMNPQDTNYYYYALGDDNVHHFFRTLSEQQAFIASQERYQ